MIREKMQNIQMKRVVILSIPYLIIFYLADKCFWLYRHCMGRSMIEKICVMLMNFPLAFANWFPSFYLQDLLGGVIVALIFRIVLYYKAKNAKKFRHGEEYGSARWGNRKDIEPFEDPVFENNIILTETERLPYHVRLLLDEFSNIGQIPKFDKLIATIRSREISASIILQSQSQLKTIYKDAAETITGNCDTVLFLGGKESSTLKEISETLGKETIDLYNTSDTRGTSQSYGLNYQKTGKELMSRDELAVMDGNKCILQLRGVRPFLSNKYDITKHKRYKELADEDERNAFDVEKYLEHKLVFSQDTEFEVYEVNVTEEDVKEAEQNIS